MERDFLSVDDLAPEELSSVLDLSAKVKAQPGDYAARMAGRSVAMVFEKPSTRTRVSFEIAIASSGGHPVALSGAELQLGRGETIEDTGRVLSRYVDAIVLRTFEQERLEVLASASTVPVVNALSDFEHPCQCLADLLTVRETKGDLAGLTLTYLGDGNNVTHSLLLGGVKAGMHVRAGTPPGFEPIPQVMHRAAEIAASTGGSATVMPDPVEASRDADVLYTDVWASMGQEAEADERALVFPAYALDRGKVEVAKPDAIVMHCLPAHRGQEITDEVIDGPRSVVWDQAENRMHTQKALLLWLLGLA
ncbi:MAG TPA: ornithine carbamoyltransferase [Actinomycetota bacterium]|nr:ornithine carbamoyltransferase [Actinomycetota bacterium]